MTPRDTALGRDLNFVIGELKLTYLTNRARFIIHSRTDIAGFLIFVA
jgi:hypothetical protein